MNKVVFLTAVKTTFSIWFWILSTHWASQWLIYEMLGSVSTNTQTNLHTILQGVVFHLIRNVNYLCIVCPVVVCLCGLVESCDRDQGGAAASMTLELFASSLPSSLSLSHLAVKWRNVFKASSNFTGALTTSSHTDVAACVAGVVELVCVHVCFLGHRVLLFLENPLMEKCVVWSLIFMVRAWRAAKEK